jgi:hypothetical protein
LSSEVDICNLALSNIGDEAEVIAIKPPDDSVQARHCGRFYPISRDELLEMHTWTFAVTRATLAVVAAGAPSEWAYAYALPAKYLKALAVLRPDAYEDDKGEDFIIESDADGGRILYTNVEEAVLRYIRVIEDTTKFTPGFVIALSHLLASKLAGPMIKGTTGMQVSQGQMKLFMVELANARSQDANSGQRSTYANRISSIQRARGGPWPWSGGGGFR